MKKIFNVDETFNKMRIDRFLRNHFGNIPQGLIEKSLRNGKIKLNKKKVKSSNQLKNGDLIELFNFRYESSAIENKIKFIPGKDVIKENEESIIENNDDFVVLNKSAGLAVQGGTKSKKNLIDIFAKSKIFNNSKPFSVHRLDKDTSGVFIMAKNRKTAQLLTSLFRLRKVHKSYLAITNGEFELNKGKFLDNLTRFDNKKKIIEKAETNFKVLDKNNNATLLLLKPITGRKHQLRKHLSLHGHSILGDNKYIFKTNNKSINKN
jgi:Pseudouridylate synthases, 23S RNA-specific